MRAIPTLISRRFRLCITVVAFMIVASGIIPLHAQQVKVLGGGSLIIGSGSSVNIDGDLMIADSSSIDDSGIVRIGGDLVNTGRGLFTYNGGSVEFNGTIQQSIVACEDVPFYSLAINNPNGVKLKGNITVDHSISFLNGKLFADSSILNLSSPAAQVVGADSEKYVVTSAMGGLHWGLRAKGDTISIPPMQFPIGDDHYATVTLAFQSGSSGPLNVTGWVDHSMDSIPSLGISRSNRCQSAWNFAAASGENVPPYDAIFDLTSTVHFGDYSKYVVVQIDSLGRNKTFPKCEVKSWHNAYVRDLTSFGKFVFGEPANSSVPAAGLNHNLDVQVYPNPVTNSGTVRFALPVSTRGVDLTLIDASGREVQSLITGEALGAGIHNIDFDASDLPNGAYFLRLHMDGAIYTANVRVIH